MLRLVVTILLILHGLIHLLGFVKHWRLAEVAQLSGRTLVPLSEALGRVVGLLWLLATLVLLAAAALRIGGNTWWWIAGAAGVLLSQALIVLQWSDARAGTVVNVLLVLPIVVGFATARFHRANETHARALLASAPAEPPAVLRAEDITSLPAPVRRWLAASGAVGQPRARTVRVRQRGEMRTKPGGDFMHAEAMQYFTVDEPGFVWTVDVVMMGVVPVVGRDSYVSGHGRMFIQAAGLVTVADGTGEKFDQGTLLRFLGEIIWFPSAAIAPYIRWDAVDEHRARATITSHGVTASALFEFDDLGRLTTFSAKRYFNGETLEDWIIPIREWQRIRGIEVPTRGSVIWRLTAGDFEYYRWEVVDVQTNLRTLWGEDGPGGGA